MYVNGPEKNLKTQKFLKNPKLTDFWMNNNISEKVNHNKNHQKSYNKLSNFHKPKKK